jgi:hypothetical protein
MPLRTSPNHSGKERDEAYPSEVAGARPIGMTRIFCDEEGESAIRGNPSDDRVAQFNRELRKGGSEE